MLTLNLNRTLVLDNTGWSLNGMNYSDYFIPISSSCVDSNKNKMEKTVSVIDPQDGSKKTFNNPIADIYHYSKSLRIYIPEEFLGPLKKIHEHPLLWWTGQIMAYLTRYTQQFQDEIDRTEEAIGFTDSCVGYID
jgi:glycoprotein 6-alpha-L-fucosyltransferase